LQRAHPFRDAGQFSFQLRGVAIELLQLLGLDLSFELELPQIADERPFVGSEAVRFPLQRLQPFGPETTCGLRCVAPCFLHSLDSDASSPLFVRASRNIG